MVDEPGSDLRQATRAMLDVLTGMVMMLAEQISALDREIARRAKEEDMPSRLMTIPGVGPITATAIAARAPPVETFRKGRDFAAWLGLTPVQRSTGGKQKLGATSKDGRADHTPPAHHWCSGTGAPDQPTRAAAGIMVGAHARRKPRMLVITALANKMERTVWALLAHNEVYRAPAVAAT